MRQKLTDNIRSARQTRTIAVLSIVFQLLMLPSAKNWLLAMTGIVVVAFIIQYSTDRIHHYNELLHRHHHDGDEGGTV